MMDFNRVIDRRGTFCTQWDYVKDRFGEEGLLPFTISDTDFTVPEVVLDALSKRMQHPVFGYTRWNHPTFKSSVVNWYENRFQTMIDPAWISYSPSVIYSIAKLIQLVSNNGEGVVVQTPAYDAFYKLIRQNNRLIVENPLTYQEGKYTIDFDDLEEKLSEQNNKILLLCSPHNPTGRVWSKDELKTIISLCQKYDIFLIADEIHMDIVREGYQHHPILKWTNEQVALVTSGSKTFNFPGLIFSYAILPDEKLRNLYQQALKEQDGLSSTSIFGMIATYTAYDACQTWVDELNQYIDGNFQYVTAYLHEFLPDIKVITSESTYLMWLDTEATGYSMLDIQASLIHEGKVAIMAGEVYGEQCQNFLRLNIGCSREKLEKGLERLRTSFLKLASTKELP